MSHKKAVPPALWGSSIIGLFFLALIFLPKILSQKNYTFITPPATSVQADFPLDGMLTILRGTEGVGKKVTLRHFLKDNRTVIVNFWATWCPPCLEELPSLEFFNRQLHGKTDSSTPILVTISVDEKAEDITRLYKTLDFTPTLIVLHDREGELSRSVGTSKFPETYWISAQGRILHKWIGPQNWMSGDILHRLVAPLPKL